jgi:hypothetical protein
MCVAARPTIDPLKAAICPHPSDYGWLADDHAQLKPLRPYRDSAGAKGRWMRPLERGFARKEAAGKAAMPGFGQI